MEIGAGHPYAQVSKCKIAAAGALLWVDRPVLSGQNSKIQNFLLFLPSPKRIRPKGDAKEIAIEPRPSKKSTRNHMAILSLPQRQRESELLCKKKKTFSKAKGWTFMDQDVCQMWRVEVGGVRMNVRWCICVHTSVPALFSECANSVSHLLPFH